MTLWSFTALHWDTKKTRFTRTWQEAAPVAVDDVGAGLLPHVLEDLESSLGLVLQLFISIPAPQEVLR